eukprot:CAMPEP_0194290680 /NCGR_PEP_ID=MMETSP0169-20130528/41813_1 /TAXON_ID=218684 /ORGANISM="Corethron pennatum, Strain L29A3" /LENGTH=628 /DNA_ID=CAMNT_0039038347 /DNA_START=567 /DNA_END=2453 /DNA_ORIENTATION=-
MGNEHSTASAQGDVARTENNANPNGPDPSSSEPPRNFSPPRGWSNGTPSSSGNPPLHALPAAATLRSPPGSAPPHVQRPSQNNSLRPVPRGDLARLSIHPAPDSRSPIPPVVPPHGAGDVRDWEQAWNDDGDDDGPDTDEETGHSDAASDEAEDEGRMPASENDDSSSDVLGRNAEEVLDGEGEPSEGEAQPAAGPAHSQDEVARQATALAAAAALVVDISPKSASSQSSRPSVKMFSLLRVLGKGSFGKVLLVQKKHGRDISGLFAMKVLKKAHLVRRKQIGRTQTERRVLAVADHPFIMRLHYAFQTDEKLFLVLDYCPGGELFFHLSRYVTFPERVARFYAAELLLAIGHLHGKGIIYRDLKPENVLLDAEGHVKLGDFGLAKDGISHPCRGAQSMCGTPEYMAPEMLCSSGHGFCVDYWELGMLSFEMMTGLPPWYTTDRSRLFRRIKGAALVVPPNIKADAENYVRKLLVRDPYQRLGFDGPHEIQAHRFFRSVHWDQLLDRRCQPPIRPCEGWRAQEGALFERPAGTPAAAGTTAAPTHVTTEDGDKGAFSIDALTENFESQFTRLPVETDGDTPLGRGGSGGGSGVEENDGRDGNPIFHGFTFDAQTTATAISTSDDGNSV